MAPTALLSVSDKQGLVPLAEGLLRHGYRLLSSGGTATTLAQAGLSVTRVADHTGAPEILGGRVKTLHPRIHGGILARREDPAHRADLEAQGIDPIDVVVVNLYPFVRTVADPSVSWETAIETIDIGGPAMVRAAAKNHDAVTVVVDPADYATVLAELDAHDGATSPALRAQLAAKAFAHTARYDSMVASYLQTRNPVPGEDFPRVLPLVFEKVQGLRYGENPHQKAAFYRDPAARGPSVANARSLQGKELSFNNIADADTAIECVRQFETPACVIVKHANPCGVATAPDIAAAYEAAHRTDPTSAYGGIIAFNRPVDGEAATAVARQFVEVLMAPAFTGEALEVFKAKANVRLLQIALPPGGAPDRDQGRNLMDAKRVGSGLLLQTADNRVLRREDLSFPTRLKPTEAQLNDLLFAWTVAKYVKSNAIVFCGGGMTLGVGAGQMSRIDSARIASIKAGHAGLSLQGSAVASDAFFPFRDGLDVVCEAGATCVIQPGGSVRDDEVIAAADERGIAMVLTGVRHFRH